MLALARLFLWLGFTAFGGPAAHIALMKQEVVDRLGWLSEQEFLDLLGATNLIPGPNSTELAIHIGYRRAGWGGLLVAGACFILPAVLIVTGLAWSYARYGKLPQVQGALYLAKPVIVAVVLQAIAGLLKPALKSRGLVALAALCLALALLGVDELIVLFGAGLLWGMRLARARSAALLVAASLALILAPMALTGFTPERAPFGLAPLFLFFLKVGSVLYGSGYVLLAFLESTLVEQWGWLTRGQLLDAVAVGQVTPGPVFTTATFIGYLLAGLPGATVATVGIFLPSFALVALSGPLVSRMRRSPVAGAFLDGVNAAALSLMLAVTWRLGREALVDPVTGGLALLSAVALLKLRINSAWLLLLASLLGLLLGSRAV